MQYCQKRFIVRLAVYLIARLRPLNLHRPLNVLPNVAILFSNVMVLVWVVHHNLSMWCILGSCIFYK